MKYINTKTRMIIESDCAIEGKLWKPLTGEPVKKAEPKAEPKTEAVKEEVKAEPKEEPKAEKKPAKAAAKNTVKPRTNRGK